MNGKSLRVGVLAVLYVLAVLGGMRAAEEKPADEGKVEDFKGKAFDLKEKGKAAITLAFPAGKEVFVTVRSEKKTDVNLFIYDAAKQQCVCNAMQHVAARRTIKFGDSLIGAYTCALR